MKPTEKCKQNILFSVSIVFISFNYYNTICVMSKIRRIREKVNNYLYDHYKLKVTIHQTKGVFYAIISAFIFAFGFTCFITPGSNAEPAFKIVTGGISGLSQNIAKIVEIFGGKLPDYIIEAMGYTVFNVPLAIFAFIKIGKRFSILTALNVVVSSLFIYFIPTWGLSDQIGNNFLIINQPVARLFFGGLCTGLGSALAYKGEISCGGIDIISYYFSLRKSTSVGKYSMMVNGVIVTLYSVLIIIQDANRYDTAIISLFYSATYTLVAITVIDAINLRNKKVQIQFITKNPKLAKVLITHFPHGATITKGQGAYTLNDEQIVYMIVSSFEVKSAVALARKVDPNVFISVISLIQVYGNFYIRPIE